MSKKLHSKLLSVILVIAICCATLCSSLIAANAAIEDYSGTYTISVGDEKNAVPFGANKVTATVTFELPAGFASGEFTITSDSKYSGVSNLKIVDGTVKQLFADKDITFSAENFEICALNGYVASFEDTDGYLYTSLTLQFDYDIATYIGNGTTQSYPVSITVDDSTFGVDTDNVNASFSAADGSDTMFHSHSAWSDVALEDTNTTQGDNQHTMISATCHLCATVVFKDSSDKSTLSAHKQILPDYTEFADDLQIKNPRSGSTADSNMGISGVTVDYRNDGTLDVNVHTYTQHNFTSLILVCDENGKELFRTSTTPTGSSMYGESGNGFVSGTNYYTLTGLSARDIDTQLYVTMVGCWGNSGNNNLVYSRTMPFKLADYCTSVIGDANGTELGNVVWGDASEEKKQADKNVAAALCYYSAAIDESVFEHVTANNGTLPGDTTGTPENKQIVEWTKIYSNGNHENYPFSSWDDFIASMSGSGKEGEPYIITTAEQMFYLTAGSGITAANTQGVYFEVDKSIGAFDFKTSDNILINSTIDSVKNVSWYKYYNEAGVFSGNFNGNGVVIYNLFRSGNKPGLFATLGDGAVIKNVTVTASGFATSLDGAGAYAQTSGGIFGQLSGTWGESSVTIENCVVKNCYIRNVYGNNATGDNERKFEYGVGAIGGYTGGVKAIIKNCYVANNEYQVVAEELGTKTGLLGYVGVAPEISNTICLGVTPYTTWDTTTLSLGINPLNGAYPSNFSNVYTDQSTDDWYTDLANTTKASFADGQVKKLTTDQLTGLNATTNTLLNFESDWIAVDGGYPELSVFHKMQTVSLGNSSGHTEKCVVKIDGTACTVKSPTVTPHDLTVEKEVDGVKYSTCSACGWGKKVVGTTIVPNNKITVTWTDGAKPTTFPDSGISEGTGDIDTPYIISTPAQLYYVAMYAGADSAGQYYEVDSEVAVFDMNSNGFGYTGNAFQGNLNGNGVEIINFNTSGWHTGLFSLVGGNVTIENIKITGATIESSGDNAGGFVGTTSGTTNLNISNCIVSDSVIKGKGRAGAIIGSVGGQYVTINNCFIANNTVVANCDNTKRYESDGVTEYTAAKYASEYPQNAVIGYGYYDDRRYINNSIVIGNDASIRVSSVSNVYTDITPTNNLSGITQLTTNDLTGANALTNMTFDDMSAWFATDSYPELHAMHDMVMQYNNDDSHKLVCADVIDGTACTTCGVETAHADAGNSTCECGFVIEELIDTLALITEKFPNNADAIISILLGSEEEETLFETAFATNILFTKAYDADNEEINGTIDDCCLYATSLNLKTTPHIAFTFAFQGEYRTDKANITATFTCGETVATVSGADMINNAGAGRYHLYRFKELPVVNLCKPISVEVKYGDNTLVKGTYSAAGYAISAIELGAQYKWHAEAAKALVYYSEMLAARYGA